ncbi:MAG: hypothetical protein JZU62_00195 [Sulfuricurvum sp.]|uniref:hypothetical protein n=1 Tax=Sulfuricurvum sp. TaxID=2025608 RepID=UPI0025FD90CC|nr:hypothetical protein [Sulfuricurvum sp.]MBV5320084.1 hypothetical protein [Sulfuricurvum sp.]
MNILLFNDNPVVRKLVALSAQKTKDDLSVVWSVDEIEESEYDLLIVDDALYSDDMFESLNAKIRVKSKLLMATRGNETPPGFDNVINKPFLPTDLVDMFIQIDKKVGGISNQESPIETPVYSINLEDALPEIEHSEEGPVNIDGIDMEDEDFDFSNLEDFDEKLPEIGILDHEEVQEVQGLLDDTDNEAMSTQEDIIVEGLDDLEFPKEDDLHNNISDELIFSEMPALDEMDEGILNFDDVLEDELLKLDNETPEKELIDKNAFDMDDFSPSLEEESAFEDKVSSDDMDILGSIDDENYLDHLEAKINNAVNGLGSDDLERELSTDDFDDDLMEDLGIEEEASPEEELPVEEPLVENTPIAEGNDSSDFDEFDMLDERELKRAVGEEVEDQVEAEVEDFGGFEDESTLEMEGIDEEDELALIEDITPSLETQPAHNDGVEALQALLKALSNEDVAKSLKGMNISININFGNEK